MVIRHWLNEYSPAIRLLCNTSLNRSYYPGENVAMRMMPQCKLSPVGTNLAYTTNYGKLSKKER